MLRVYRLNPEFKLDIDPINIMYIDIQSEAEISSKCNPMEVPEPIHETCPLYSRNYLVLQEKGEHNTPTISDIEIIKSIPGTSLPGTYTVALDELFAQDTDGNYVNIFKESFVATKPSEFVISIRFSLTEGEKFTTDQNEALACSISYYHPIAPLIETVVPEDSGIRPQMTSLGGRSQRRLREEQIRYKGSLISPDPFPDLGNPGRIFSMATLLTFTRYSDEYIEIGGQGNRTSRYARVDIYNLPPPVHSELLVGNMFNKDPHTLWGVRSSGLNHLRAFIEQFHEMEEVWDEIIKIPGITIPHFDRIKDFSRELRDRERHQY